MSDAFIRKSVERRDDASPERGAPRIESLVHEAPLHIKLNGVSYTTTMRTPGEDEALARGLLFTEGIVPDPAAACAYRGIPDPETGAIACIEVEVEPACVARSVEGRRTVMSTSSCGICGTREPGDLEVYGTPLAVRDSGAVEVGAISDMIAVMRERQELFRATGGSHAAAVFDLAGAIMNVQEDIGRHNAVDKVVGNLIRRGALSQANALLVSGRVSYEIVYKAYRAEVPFLFAVSAASSMAVETAERLGITLAGFCRDGRVTIYTHPERIVAGAPAKS